ncbi:MAG: DivIVA domain-containing protein [Gemmatimonadaceae bacterium]
MTDDAFHLTALDARRYDFGNALRGYDRARVDQFRDQVAEELERLSRANQELEVKARNFHEQLRAFRERDKALNDALISAQQLRGEIREQAQREAQLIIREAQGDSERSLEMLRGEIRRAEDDLQNLWRNRRSYVQQLRQLMERQLHDLDSADMVPPPSGIALPASETQREQPREAAREFGSEPRNEAPREMSAPVVREFQTPREVSAPPPVHIPLHAPLQHTQTFATPTRDLPSVPPLAVPPVQQRPSIPTPSWLDVVDGE